MKCADRVLGDEQLVPCTKPSHDAVPRVARADGEDTPPEVVLRRLLLKHLRNKSHECCSAKCAPIPRFRQRGSGQGTPYQKPWVAAGLALGPESTPRSRRAEICRTVAAHAEGGERWKGVSYRGAFKVVCLTVSVCDLICLTAWVR